MTIHLPGFPGQSSTHIGHGIVASVIVALAHAGWHDPMRTFVTASVVALAFRLKEWNDTRKHNRDGLSPMHVMDELGTTLIGDRYGDLNGPYTVVVLTWLLWLAEVLV